MKHNLLLVFILLCSFGAAHAQNYHNRSGDLSVQSQQPILVAIDNRLYDLAGTDITIGNIPQGNHKVQLYRVQNSRRAGQGPLLYETNFRLEAGQRLVGQWDGYNRVLRISTQPRNYQDYGSGFQVLGNNYHQEYGQGSDNYQHPDNYPDNRRLTSQQVNDLKAIVDRVVSDGSKVSQMKQLLADKTYTVAQVRQMAGWLSFDSYRLDFLKWAYNNTEDKANYMQVYPLLTFDNSIKELTDYLGQQHR